MTFNRKALNADFLRGLILAIGFLLVPIFREVSFDLHEDCSIGDHRQLGRQGTRRLKNKSLFPISKLNLVNGRNFLPSLKAKNLNFGIT